MVDLSLLTQTSPDRASSLQLNASGGLLVAAVIKYGDNILKNFTTSCSVILGTSTARTAALAPEASARPPIRTRRAAVIVCAPMRLR